MTREALVIAHTAREQIRKMAAATVGQLQAAGFVVRMLADEAADVQAPEVTIVPLDEAADGCEVVFVFGGDGTFLRAAELARPAQVPLLGVNFGHVGFLAEAEPEALAETIDLIISGRYTVEERTTLDVAVTVAGRLLAEGWALNEASLEKSRHERMLEIAVAIDGRPLLRFGCDGVLCSTPTGSTAYAFSAGGPIVWPTVDALVVVPNAAHALFARPIVVAPTSVVDLDLISAEHDGALSCDGRRSVQVPTGGRVTVRRGQLPVRIVRLHDWSFADRLVTKFQLPVAGFRGGGPHGVDSPDVDPMGVDLTDALGVDSPDANPMGVDSPDAGPSDERSDVTSLD
jgi:NAD+ kinase